MIRFTRRFHLKNEVGNRGEDEAVVFLRSIGYRILDRNYRNDRGRALGEIDIVARDGEELVFVEVKARTAKAGMPEPLPEEGITRTKLSRLARIAQGYLREKHLESVSYRFDAILIIYRATAKKAEIRHFKSIFL
jgi:putative endonuclease